MATANAGNGPVPGRRPQLLWVTDEVPDPSLKGGSIRQYHLLKRLTERADVHLLLAGRLHDDGLRRLLGTVTEIERPAGPSPRYEALRSRMGVIPRLAPTEVALTSPVTRALAKALPPSTFDIVHVEHEWLAPLLPRARRGKWMLSFQNLLSVRLRQSAASSASHRVRWLLERDATHASRLEASALRRYDRVITVSDVDAATLGGRAAIVPNGVDIDGIRPTSLGTDPVVMFSGSWGWEPNAEAAVWTCDQLLPLLRSQLPDASLMLVGRDPPARVRDLAGRPGVEGHFDVPSVVPYLSQARVAIVPLKVGSGTRLKALEAMAAGRPVVGTTIGLEGLGLEHGRHAYVADDAEAMCARILELCLDDQRAATMAAAARQLVESRFSWEAAAQAYWQTVEETLQGESA